MRLCGNMLPQNRIINNEIINVFFKLINVNLLVSEIYIYQKSRCNDKIYGEIVALVNMTTNLREPKYTENIFRLYDPLMICREEFGSMDFVRYMLNSVIQACSLHIWCSMCSQGYF